MNPLARSVAIASCIAALIAPAIADGVKLRTVAGAYADTKGVALRAPEGVALSGGSLVVADTGNARIVRFRLDAGRIEAVAEVAVPELPYPLRIAATPGGDLFVLDGKVRRIGRIGSGNEFNGFVDLPPGAVPRSLVLDRAQNLIVLDIAGARVLVVGKDGKVAREAALPPGRGRFFSDVAVDGKGNLFVLDSVGRQIHRAASGGAFEPFGAALDDDLDFAVSLAVDEAGQVFVADQNGGGIVVLGQDGSFRGRQSAYGWKDGQLRYPSAIAIDNGQIAVADRANNRVQVFAVAP